MRILIDINHPAHVHYFRNFYKIMTSRGHDILVVARNKEIEHYLLKTFNIPFVSRGKGSTGKFSKFLYMIYADLKLLFLSLKFKPDLFLNFMHPYPSQVARLLGKTSLVFSDTEHAKLHHQLTVPFATKVLTPSCYRFDLGPKHVRFNGFMELCYLHQNYFKPDPSVLSVMNVQPHEKFVILRFVSWSAAHDYGHTGISLANKRAVIHALSQHARVFISAEGKLPADLERFRINIPFEKMHDAIYYSSLLFGESATMASEAAVLGTPSIFIDNDGRGYTDEEERTYHLVNNFTESEADLQIALQRALKIIQEDDIKGKYRRLQERLVTNSIDTTDFMIREVLKYDPQNERH